MPRAVVVTRLDHQRADFERDRRGLPAGLRRTDVLPLLPAAARRRRHVGGLIGLLSRTCDYSGGSRSSAGRPRAPAADRDARNALIEGIIAESEDETLMDRYLGGEDIDDRRRSSTTCETAVARGSFYPVLAGLRARPASALTELLEV